MSEHWPPEWDLDDENLDNPELDGENLAEVTSALASMPLPALPEAFEARISAAIRAEAATRAGPSGTPGVSATARSSSADGPSPAAAGSGAPTAASARLRRRAGVIRGARRPGRRSRTPGLGSARPSGRGRRAFLAIGSLAACLVLAGFGYLAFGRGGTSGSAYSGALAPEAAASASASGFRAASGSARPAIAPLRGRIASGPGFVVSETGTRYAPATLARQVRARVAAIGSSSQPASAPGAAAAASGAGGGYAPSAALEGCVSHLTGHQVPSLVDRASYAGRPAYVIAVPGRVWVVGLGCTATSPQLITSTALAGLSGNLRALGSVERRAILRKGACSDRRT